MIRARRVAGALLVTVAVAACGAVAEAHGTRYDKRVDALSVTALLHGPVGALVDANRQHRAQILADIRHAAAAGWAIAQVLAFFWLWRSGRAAALRDALRRRLRSVHAQRAAFGAFLGIWAPLIGLPFAFVGYRVGFNAGLSDQRADAWLLAYAERIALDALVGAILVAGVLWLVDRTRLWYIVLAAILYGAALGSVMVRPITLFGHQTYSARYSARAAIFARELDTHPIPVIVARTSLRSNALVGGAWGFGPLARIVLGDVLLDRATPSEVDAVLAHGEALVAKHDVLRSALFATTTFVITAALAVLLADRFRFRRDDDALSRLALVGALLGVVAAVSYPIFTFYARNRDAEGQHLALAATGNAASAVRLAVRRADDEMIPLCDRRYVRWYFDTRPSLARQIAEARREPNPCR